MAWGEAEDLVVQLMRDNASEEDIAKAVTNVKDVNVFHQWRDAQFSLLFHASLLCSESGVRALLSAGADPSLRSPGSGSTVLQLMAKRDQVAMAQACFDCVPDNKRNSFVNSCSNIGWSCLMSAAENNRASAVIWLLERGAAVNAQMVTGWTAMHAAAKGGHAHVLDLLLAAGGSLDATAKHRDFGRSAGLVQVAKDESVVDVIEKHRRGRMAAL